MMVAMSVALRTGLVSSGGCVAMMFDQRALPGGMCAGAQLGKAMKGRLWKAASLRGRGLSSEPTKAATGWQWAKSPARERSRAEGKNGTLTWPDIQMAKSAMNHQAQFLETMTMLEPGGKFCAAIHAAMRRTSCMALAQVQSRSWPLTGCVKSGCAGEFCSHA